MLTCKHVDRHNDCLDYWTNGPSVVVVDLPRTYPPKGHPIGNVLIMFWPILPSVRALAFASWWPTPSDENQMMALGLGLELFGAQYFLVKFP